MPQDVRSLISEPVDHYSLRRNPDPLRVNNDERALTRNSVPERATRLVFPPTDEQATLQLDLGRAFANNLDDTKVSRDFRQHMSRLRVFIDLSLLRGRIVRSLYGEHPLKLPEAEETPP
jgi:hypothetical protein